MKAHRAVFFGSVYGKEYEIINSEQWSWKRGYGRPSLKLTDRFLEYKVLESVELENPPLEIGDKIFLIELNKAYTVTDLCRSTDNSYIYYLDFVEVIEDDDKTEASRIEQSSRLENILENYNRYINDNIRSREIKLKKWYEFWK